MTRSTKGAMQWVLPDLQLELTRTLSRRMRLCRLDRCSRSKRDVFLLARICVMHARHPRTTDRHAVAGKQQATVMITAPTWPPTPTI